MVEPKEYVVQSRVTLMIRMGRVNLLINSGHQTEQAIKNKR